MGKGPLVAPKHWKDDQSLFAAQMSGELAGKTIQRIVGPAVTAEGYDVLKIVFLGGEELMIVPVPIKDPRVTALTGRTMALGISYFPRKAGRKIITPGIEVNGG